MNLVLHPGDVLVLFGADDQRHPTDWRPDELDDGDEPQDGEPEEWDEDAWAAMEPSPA